jgi:hypothetical protein
MEYEKSQKNRNFEDDIPQQKSLRSFFKSKV